MYGNSESGVV